MIGSRLGSKGVRVGSAVGSSVDDEGPSSALAATRDGTSNIYVPATAGEWDAVLAAAGITSGGPSALWLMQEAAGNPADSIGSFTLTASGSPQYQQAVTGWTRKAITYVDAGAGGLASASASLPDLATTSQLTLAYIKLPGAAPAGTRNLIVQGANATRSSIEMINTPRLRGRCSTNTADGGASPTDGGVHPCVAQVNRTASSAFACDDREKLLPTFVGTVAGKGVIFNGVTAGATSIAGGELYAASFFGAAAELTATQIKTLLQTLGWTVSWTP